MPNRLFARTATTVGIIAVAAALVLGGAGIAYSQTDAAVIHGCVDKTTGALRVLSETSPGCAALTRPCSPGISRVRRA